MPNYKKVVISADLLNVAVPTITINTAKGDGGFQHALIDSICLVDSGKVLPVVARWMFSTTRTHMFSAPQVKVKYQDEMGKMIFETIPGVSSVLFEDDGILFYNSNGVMVNEKGNPVKKRTPITTFTVMSRYEGYVKDRTLYLSKQALATCSASKAGEVRCWVSPSSTLTFTFK